MTRQFAVPLALIVSLASGHAALAQGAACKALKDDAERLACYDRPAPEASPPKTGEWSLLEDTSDLDKQKIYYISLNATKSSIARQSEKPAFARLQIRCGEKKTSLYINFGTDVAYGIRPIPVEYRIGSNKPATAQWSAAQNRSAYGPFVDPSTIPMIKQMLSADDFYVRAHDSVIGTSDALFKVEGIAEAVKPIRAACKW